METIRRLGRVQVVENEYEGCMRVLIDPCDDNILCIQVQQEEVGTGYTRTAYRTGTLEEMDILAFQPNQYIPGKIVIEESYDPPNIDDPEEFLLWEDGKVVRVHGRSVYHTEYHVLDQRIMDEILAHR